ncbi:MAG: MFS transporter [Actinomycetota bacterium]|nr:MFS transporter [Actinomycetota bacterium]
MAVEPRPRRTRRPPTPVVVDEVLNPAVQVDGTPPELQRSPQYLKVLLVLLVSATFFEGYDNSILALLLGDIQNTFHVPESTLGWARGLIELGTASAFFFTRIGDHLGRRKLLLWSVVGYTVFTALTAFSWDIWSFTLFQFAARIFLGAEYAAAVTMVVEEFPAERRGRALGTLLACAALGVIVIGILLQFGVQDGPLEWRTLYLIGLLPLLMLSVFRRRIKETRRFLEEQQRRADHEEVRKPSMWASWRRDNRRMLIAVGIVHLGRSLPLVASTSWWAYFAERERGFTSAEIGFYIIFAYGLGVLGYVACGRLMERIGRRPTAVIYFAMGAFWAVVLFQVQSKAWSFPALILAVFFGLGAAPVLGAFASELFPTDVRAQSAAWVRNIFEIAGYVFGPVLVGVLGDHATGAVGSIGDSVSLLMVLWLPGVYIVLRYIPETKGRELEDITGAVH